jgi:hypothetical protein
MARYDYRKDPLSQYRYQRRQGGPTEHVVAFCKVCEAPYHPGAYGKHARTPAHKARLVPKHKR